jgi:hypothetical protein
MLAKITSRNRITLPKAVVQDYPRAIYFEVQSKGGRIVLTPVRMSRASELREKLAVLGVTNADLRAAVKWARNRRARLRRGRV